MESIQIHQVRGKKIANRNDLFFALDKLIHEYTDNSLSIENFVALIECIVFENRQSDQFNTIELDPEFIKRARITRAIYSKYEVALEAQVSSELLELPRDVDLLESLNKSKYQPIARTLNFARLEAEALECGRDKVCCHIGHGAFPETLFALRKYLSGNDRLVGFDFDQMAHRKAEELITKFDIRSIEITQEYGERVDYSQFCHIHVAVLVRPISSLIRKVIETAPQDATLVLRNVSGLGALVYEPISSSAIQLLTQSGFRKVNTVWGHAIVHSEVFSRSI